MTRVASASILVLVGRLGGNLGYFAGALVLARGLGPTDRGAIAFFTTAALMIAVVSSSGLREAASVFVAQDVERRDRVATNTMLFGLLLALAASAVVCGSLLAAPGLRPAHLTALQIVLLGAGTLAAALLVLGYGLLMGLALFRYQAALQPVYVWVYAAALGIAWWDGRLTVTSAALIWTGGQLLGGVLLTTVSLRRTRVGRPDLALLRRMWSYGLRAWVGSLSAFLNFRVDQIIMGAISSNAALGVYAVAVNLSEVELYVPQSVSNGLVPIIAATPKEERAERTLRVFRLVMLVTLAVAVPAFVLGPFLLPLLFGAAFRPSVGPFLWLVPGGLGFVATSIFSAALVASDAPGRSSVGPFVSLVVGVALDFALIPPHGATGAAIAASAAFVAGGVAAAATFARTYSLRWRALVPHRSDAAGLIAAVRRGRA